MITITRLSRFVPCFATLVTKVLVVLMMIYHYLKPHWNIYGSTMTHKYTIEMLFHFTCSQCKNWWSIALMHDKAMNVYPEGKSYCPHCGKESITEKMNPIS